MSNIIPFDSTGNAGAVALPAHLADAFGDGNIAPRVTIDQLSYRGKVWRRIVAGEETQLTRVNPETTEEEPMSIVSVVILDHNKQRSRSFFEGNYEEGKNVSPKCYSSDGVKPDASVKEPCAATCASCPNAVKGSKITESGKQTTACAPFKRVAVIPATHIGKHPPMLLKLAQTSIWDKDNGENETKGWYAWDQYLDMLRARGAKHTAMVETRVKFDLRVAYPKLLFSAARWLNPDEVVGVKSEMTEKEEVIGHIVNGAGNEDGAMGHPATPAPAAPADDHGAAEAAAAAKALKDKQAAEMAKQAAAIDDAMAPAAAPAASKPKSPPKKAAPKPVEMKTVRTMTEAADGFSYEEMLAEGWDDDSLVAEGMMTITEVPVEAPAAAPAAKTPKAPPKKAPAPVAADVTDVQVKAPAPAPAPAGNVVSDTPAGLKSLLDGWDD